MNEEKEQIMLSLKDLIFRSLRGEKVDEDEIATLFSRIFTLSDNKKREQDQTVMIPQENPERQPVISPNSLIEAWFWYDGEQYRFHPGYRAPDITNSELIEFMEWMIERLHVQIENVRSAERNSPQKWRRSQAASQRTKPWQGPS